MTLRRRAAILACALALTAAAARADVPHHSGDDSKAWSAYLEYALTGDEAALQRLADVLGDSSFVAFEQAMLAGRRGDRVKMLERAEKAVELDPDNGEAQALLARAWFRLAEEVGAGATDSLDRAVSHAEAAVRLETADPEIYDRLAAAHGALATRAERAGDAEGALRERGLERATLETWAERFRQDVAWRQLADLARELGDRPGEAQALEEILRRGDDALLAAQRLGDVLSEIGRCEVAIPILESALEAAAADKYAGISLAVQLGDCAARAGEPQLAERAFRQALDLDPTNLIAVSGLAEALWQQGRQQDGIAELDRASRRLSGEAEPGEERRPAQDAEQRLDWLATRARWKAAHDLPDALDDARKALALAESVGTPRQRALMGALVAEAQLGRGDAAAALLAAREATRQDPSHEASLLTLLNASWAGGDRAAVLKEIADLEKKAAGPAWLARLSRWEAARGFDDGARRHARKALDAFSGSPGARAEFDVDVGEALLLAGDPQSAERLSREALSVRPWDDDAAFLLAQSLVDLGLSADADAVLAKHVAARGEDPWLLERWSAMDETRRRAPAAVEKAERALRLLDQAAPHPSARARLESRLGEAQLAAGRPSDAALTLKQAVARSPVPPGDRVVSLAQALAKSGDVAGALAAVEPALARDPSDDQLAAERARLLMLSGRKDEGVAAYEALLSDPRALPGRHGQVALALVQGGRPERGLEVAEQALQLHPMHVGLLLAAARVSDAAGRRDEAEARFRRALALEPDGAVVLNALGYSLADWGVKLDESVRLLRKAVEARPHEAAYLDSLGWALFRAGKLEEASRWLEGGLARDRDPVILAHLGHVRRAQGRDSEAVALLREALAGGLEEGAPSAREALAALGEPAGAAP